MNHIVYSTVSNEQNSGQRGYYYPENVKEYAKCNKGQHRVDILVFVVNEMKGEKSIYMDSKGRYKKQ